MTATYRAPRLLVDGRLTGPGTVTVRDGLIVSVRQDDGPGPGGRPPDVALTAGILAPGMIDLQINGVFGVDFAAAGPADWAVVRRGLARRGVTGFVPTVITAPLERLAGAVRDIEAARAGEVADLGSRILGVHVEGPFLSAEYAGAHDPTLMIDPTPAALDVLLSGPAPAIVTLAPERGHALAAVARLVDAGCVVSLGHTAATAAQVHAAADAGARMVTHVFNAQRPLGHREPGAAGAALTDPRLSVGLIADLRHVAAEIVALVFRAVAGRVVMVSDAVAAAGAPTSRTVLGGQAVHLAADGLPRRPDGRIAGSVLSLDQAVRNAVACGVDVAGALDAVTRRPADLLGRPGLGHLAPGAVADLVWWSDDLDVRRVWLGGQPV